MGIGRKNHEGFLTRFRAGIASGLSVALLAGALPAQAASITDIWVHPRNETYNPERHYKDAEGELYYHPENDLGLELGVVTVESVGKRVVRVAIGDDLLNIPKEMKGTLIPVLLYDSDGNGRVDRTLRGRLEGKEGLFDAPVLEEIDFRTARWQIGVRYQAGADGRQELHRRYLASVDSERARVAFREIEEPPAVGMGPFPPGLVIFKYMADVPFDLEAFTRQPVDFIENFEPLTRQADDDDWTVEGDRGQLVTHYAERDLFLVRTEGDYDLDVVWGDMPLDQFARKKLRVERNGDGCFSSLDTKLESDDGTPVVVPNRLLYCPDTSMALFDAPDGYEIGLTAMQGPDPFEYTEAGTSIMDNLRLYVNEINPRRPSARATDTIGGNIRAGFSDAEDDLVDAMRHGFTGRYEKNLHTGRVEYHPSPFTAVPLAMASIVRWQPLAVTRTSFSATEPAVRMLDAIQILFAGAESAVRMGGDLVSAVSNGVLNPVFQSTVGLASPGAADLVGDSIGAVAQAAVKNLPFGERSIDALSPMSLLHHDRAFAPALYTRTDLQLNIDRAFTIMDMAAINAIRNHNESNDSDGGGQESGGNGDGGDGNGSNGGGGNGNGGNGGGGCGLFDGDCGLWDRDKDWIDIDIDIDICGDGPD